jgi:hypothetical protein
VGGTVDMTFAIFDGLTSGTALWFESHQVSVEDGIYSLMLGGDTVIPASVMDSTNLYIAISVNGETLVPRHKITSVLSTINSDLINGKRLESGTRTLSLPMPANQATEHVAFERPFSQPPRVVVTHLDQLIDGELFISALIYNITTEGFDVDYISHSGNPASGSATFGYEAFGE